MTQNHSSMITDFRLQVFKAVADKLSFTKAASALLISQPAVTKHIGELEKQLGVPLFTRHGSSISLTRHGEQALDYANRILALYSDFNDAFADDGKVPAGHLRIGASTTIAQYVLPDILASFKRRYPEISIEMSNANTEVIEELVAGGKIDLGLIEGKHSGRTLHYELFMKDELVLVVSSVNPVFRNDEISIEDLQKMPLVIRENGSGTLDILEEALARHGLQLKNMNIEIQLGSTESIKRYIQRSDAGAFISIQAVADDIARNKLRIIDTEGLDIIRHFSFVEPHGHHGRLSDLFKQFCTAHNNFKL